MKQRRLRLRKKLSKLHIGLRTLKTVAAVILAMLISEALGTTDSRVIFAMSGAMAAVAPTFKESLEACVSNVVGVIVGALCGIALAALPIHPFVAIGIGIVLLITLYNLLCFHYSPVLPCLILVLICTSADIEPFSYAIGRIWDTAIGLSIGLVINSLVFPYDNSKNIRRTAAGLNREVIRILEELFDGDAVIPELKKMQKAIDTLDIQLDIFANQRLLLKLRRQSLELASFQECEGKARQLVAHLEVLCAMGLPGILSLENRQRLADCSADIRDMRTFTEPTQKDIITNFHVSQILTLRQELLDVLKRSR